MKRLVLIIAALPFVYLGGEQAYWLAWHKATYGYWLVRYRPMTEADIKCIPPGTILIKNGEYLSFPIELIEWCGFNVTITGTPVNASPPAR